MTTVFYVIEYQCGEKGCPIFLDGTESHDWEWETYNPNPGKVLIKHDYSFSITDKDIDELELDYAGSPIRFASTEFLEVCNSVGALYRAVPIRVYLATGAETRKKYFYFLTAQWESLLDESASSYSLELSSDSASPSVNKFYPGAHSYNWIEKFVVREGVESDIFWCSEIMEHVCSQRFVDESTRRKLQGVKFTALDDSFKYDPWGDLPK